jgi:hypothetical protein
LRPNAEEGKDAGKCIYDVQPRTSAVPKLFFSEPGKGPTTAAYRIDVDPSSITVISENGREVTSFKTLRKKYLSLCSRKEPFVVAEGTKRENEQTFRASPRRTTSEYGSMLRAYFASVEHKMRKNLLLELYRRRDYERFCVTPWVTASDDPNDQSTARSIYRLAKLRHSAIIGGVGSGKTTALRLLTLHCCRRPSRGTIPVYISLASVRAKGKRPEPSQFERHINVELKKLGCRPLKALMRIPGRSLLLLLDGWDEVASDRTRELVEQYLHRSGHRYIIASRPGAWRTFPSCSQFDMCTLSPIMIRLFLQKRLKDRQKVKAFIAWIEESPWMAELAKNPLDLSVMGIVFEDAESDVHQLTKTAIYERAFNVILNAYHRSHRRTRTRGISLDAIVAVLEECAYRSMKMGDGRVFAEGTLDAAARAVLGYVQGDLADRLAGRQGIIRRTSLDFHGTGNG